MKKCSKCGEEKPLKEFDTSKKAKDGKHTQCKLCRALYRESRRAEQRLYDNTISKARKYGISVEELADRMKVTKCEICGTSEPKGRHNVFHIDHNHDTGEVRGMLCHDCNTGYGSFKEDVEILNKAILYKKKYG